MRRSALAAHLTTWSNIRILINMRKDHEIIIKKCVERAFELYVRKKIRQPTGKHFDLRTKRRHRQKSRVVIISSLRKAWNSPPFTFLSAKLIDEFPKTNRRGGGEKKVSKKNIFYLLRHHMWILFTFIMSWSCGEETSLAWVHPLHCIRMIAFESDMAYGGECERSVWCGGPTLRASRGHLVFFISSTIFCPIHTHMWIIFMTEWKAAKCAVASVLRSA